MSASAFRTRLRSLRPRLVAWTPWAIALLLPLLSVTSVRGASPQAATRRIDFNRDIRPILADNCYQCHGPDAAKRKAGLRLDQSEGARLVLESGHTAIVPGQTAKSRLLEVVATQDDTERMPPSRTGKRLSGEQISLLKRWIEEGAEWKQIGRASCRERVCLYV